MRQAPGAGAGGGAPALPPAGRRRPAPPASHTLVGRGRIDARIVEAAPTLYQIEARLRAALDDPTPRTDVHAAFAPRPRRGWRAGAVPAPARTAAALVLLYPVDARAHLVLTRRADTLGRHAGQISLPGGAVDDDETIEEAALREAREEIGVTAARVVGALTALHVAVSNFTLHPVVAVADRRPRFAAAAGEVAHVIEAPLDHLCDAASRRRGWAWRGAEPIAVPYFEVRGERVWGATAMVLGELIHLLGEDGGSAG